MLLPRFLFLLLVAVSAFAQQARVLGTVESALPTLQVKTDQGQLLEVALNPNGAIRKVAPGAKDLSEAQTVSIDDLAPVTASCCAEPSPAPPLPPTASSS